MLQSIPRPGVPPVILLGATVCVLVAYTAAVLLRPSVPDWKREQDREY